MGKDLATEKGDHSKLGTISYYVGDDIILCNLYGQYHWSKYKLPYGGNTDYKALEEALEAFRDLLLNSDNDIHTIGLPKLGCGLAGGDWKIVETMIMRVFEDTSYNIVIYYL